MLARLASAVKAGDIPKAEAPLPTPVPQANSRAALRVRVARHAIDHPAKLRAVLERAPESAKPALRRAIDVSVTRYKKALEALD